MARALKTCRLYRSGNPLVQGVRDSTVESLLQLVRVHGGWHLSFRPDEILFGQESIIKNIARSAEQGTRVALPLAEAG